MRILASQRVLERRRSSARSLRRKNNEAPAMHYFHQVDDPYSFIMAQQLSHFAAAIDIPIITHLGSGPTDAFKGDASRYDRWAMEDASSIAPFLGAPIRVANGFTRPKLPAAEQISAANTELAALLANKLARADFFPSLKQPAKPYGDTSSPPALALLLREEQKPLLMQATSEGSASDTTKAAPSTSMGNGIGAPTGYLICSDVWPLRVMQGQRVRISTPTKPVPRLR